MIGAQGRVAVGLDLGTSGARVAAVDSGTSRVLAVRRCGYGEKGGRDAAGWASAVWGALGKLPVEVRRDVGSIAIDGTSASALLLDKSTGRPSCAPLMYDDAPGVARPHVSETLAALVPAGHTAGAQTSTLAKLLFWKGEGRLRDGTNVLLHQADYAAYLLTGEFFTDENNALKLGYDPDPACSGWPPWLLKDKALAGALPMKVVTPGTAVAHLSSEASTKLEIPESCMVCGGTTDSIAAFLAAGVSQPGEAVTSLGSTLAVKLVSEARVDNSGHGVYSHRINGMWLVGGASNSGGAALKQYFDDEELTTLSMKIDPSQKSSLDYYPLPKPGERFPIVDPNLPSKTSPRPESEADFLHGLLEGIARIEVAAYSRLELLGADKVSRVATAGGGAQNQTWIAIRERCLGVPVYAARELEACVGAAQLAQQALER